MFINIIWEEQSEKVTAQKYLDELTSYHEVPKAISTTLIWKLIRGTRLMTEPNSN